MKINTEQITKEFCKGKILLFFPATKEEAYLVQEKLFGLGFKLPGNSTMHLPLSICVSDGLMLQRDGKIYTDPSPKSRDEGLLCTSDQFDKPSTGSGLPAELTSETLSDFFRPEKWTGRIAEMRHHWEKIPEPLKNKFNNEAFGDALTVTQQNTLKRRSVPVLKKN